MRGHRQWIALPVALLAAVLPGARAPGSAAELPPDLLHTYQPVLFFHPDEDWAPERAEVFLRGARLERQIAAGTWALAPGPAPTSSAGCAFNPCYRLNLPCPLRGGDACYEKLSTAAEWNVPVLYGKELAVPPGTTPPPGFAEPPRYLLRYWLFYEFDDWRSPHRRLWQAHEADWETISIGLDAAGTPQFAAYSQHCSGSIRAWSGVTKRGGTHPVSYIALGSHANYFTSTATSTRFTECLKKGLAAAAAARAARIVRLAQDRVVDRMGSAHPLGPAGLPGTAPMQLVPLDTSATWTRFPGRWSEGQILWLGSTPHSITTVSQGAGPATPKWSTTSIPSLWHTDSS